jgi:hypothetical protein
MIQRRTWKDVTPLPDGEGLMMGNTKIIGQMNFGGMTYQFAGLHPDDAAERAARWLQQNTGQDEVEQLVLRVVENNEAAQTSLMSNFILTKVGTAVVVSPSLIKPKVYR